MLLDILVTYVVFSIILMAAAFLCNPYESSFKWFFWPIMASKALFRGMLEALKS